MSAGSKTGDVITVDFQTYNASDVTVAPDALPLAVLVINGTNNGATCTVTNKATGIYKVAVTLPTIAEADILQIRVAYIISGATRHWHIWDGIGVTSQSDDLAGQITALDATVQDLVSDVEDIITVINSINTSFAAAGRIAIPRVSYQGTLNLYKGDSYGNGLNPSIEIPYTNSNDISATTAHIEITSEPNGEGTVYYTATDGTITDNGGGSWTIAYDIPTTGTDDLTIGAETAYYHTWIVEGADTATTGKGSVNVR